MQIAITREVSPSVVNCELTHLTRTPIDLERARMQHHQYEELLSELGCRLVRLPAEPKLPDSVFVEDAAIVLDELAVITRPGAESRRAETSSIAAALTQYRKLAYIEPPGTLDGGDVLHVGKTLYVGLSSRSDSQAIAQLRHIVAAFGYSVIAVQLHECLHLKTAVTQVAEGTLLINRSWVDADVFASMHCIDVDPLEPFGANAVRVGSALVYPMAFPKTRAHLVSQGINVRTVDASELAKAEGGVTCSSLIFTA